VKPRYIAISLALPMSLLLQRIYPNNFIRFKDSA
jgi:hypothetical protein